MTARRAGPRTRRLGLLAIAGAAHALSFAPGPLPGWALPLVQCAALAFLVFQTLRAPSVRQAAIGGLVFGGLTYSVGLYWLYISLHVYGGMALPLAVGGVLALAAYLALYPAIACAVARRLAPWPAGVPSPIYLLGSASVFGAAWAGTEWLRGTLLTGFPWLNIGYAHVDSPLAGWSSVLGVYGVAFFAACAAAALASLWVHGPLRNARHGAPPLAALVIVAIGAWLARVDWSVPIGAPLTVELVQGNVPQSQKFDPAQMEAGIVSHMRLALNSGAAQARPDMVLLPETVLPVFQDQLAPSVWETWRDIAARRDTTIVMGTPLHTRHDNVSGWTNSVIGIDAETPLDTIRDARTDMRYDKRQLVPFGEFVPTGFRWFVDAMQMPLGDFNRGAERQRPFPIGEQHVAFNICYEDLFGEDLLPALHNGDDGSLGATVMANVSNLGWFGDTWALRQHWQIARLRTIETARPMLVATNTGLTGAIDHRGQVVAVLAPHIPAVLPVTVQGMAGLTPYAQVGNVAVLVLIGLSLAVAIVLRCRGAQG